MNERIKELALQATEYANEQNELHGVGYVITFKEKFAELIVRECADLFDDDPESGTRYTGVACKGIIKHYFGIEDAFDFLNKHVGVEE